MFPETSQKLLEEVDEIFDDSTPGSIKYIGTPAWKTHVDRNTRRLERGELDAEDKANIRTVSHDDNVRETREVVPQKMG